VQEKPVFRDRLPVHNSADDHDVQTYVLQVDGLVGQCLKLTAADLERLPQEDLVEDFTCLEGWTVPGVRWRGILFETVLSLARPRPQALWVQASARDFSLPLSLDRAKRALLAIRLGEDPVPVEHGGPVRLFVPGGECFMQIKWLDHLELRNEPGANTAEATALDRLRSQPAG
jgi:DMSO/TMAO reductase YedYZ molybdopterin-dependent catalytic subunit